MNLVAITPKPISVPIRVVSDGKVPIKIAIEQAKKLAIDLRANVVLEFNNDYLVSPDGSVIVID